MTLLSSIEGMLAQFDQAALRRSDKLLKAVDGLGEAITVLHDDVHAIEPVRVDMTRELADDIVRKIHGPLTIPREFSNWIRKQSERGQFIQRFALGYGSRPGFVEMILQPNGVLRIEIKDEYNAPVWMATFVPPDFAGIRP